MFPRLLQVTYHYSQGFSRAFLSLPQALNGYIAGGITGEEKTAKPLDCQNVTFF
ncbi:unnamed protein product [marine sediment metagenome]|uniref:Uncharacterized protein n=1 Tax=marine sediment metagenome TaxID=412755 RepID=X0WA51_9ZZZZ